MCQTGASMERRGLDDKGLLVPLTLRAHLGAYLSLTGQFNI